MRTPLLLTRRMSLPKRVLTGGSVALLCAAGVVATGTPASASPAPGTSSQSFSFAQTLQAWTVPTGVYAVMLSVTGGSGGSGTSSTGAAGGPGGFGARVTETLPVQPGQTFQILLGSAAAGSDGGSGFHNLVGGGGVVSSGHDTSGAGGAASEIDLNGTVQAIAGGGGGGGGGGAVYGQNGGAGASADGTSAGGNGTGVGAGAGGSGSIGSTSGEHGQASAAGSLAGNGGGGGGGWNNVNLGGGHGGSGGTEGGGGGGGGAGGLSYARSSSATFGTATTAGDGSVSFTWANGLSLMSAVTVNAASSPAGAPVTFTDTLTPMVAGTPSPGGTVTFQEYNVNTGVSTDLATVPLTNGVATFTTSSLAVGTHQITALYTGDAIYYPAYTGYIAATIITPVFGLQLSTSQVNFGTVPLGTSHTKLVTLTNTGNVPWNFGGANTSAFGIGLTAGGSCGSATLAPGGSCTFNVIYIPQQSGTYGGQITIYDNFPSPLIIPVTGKGVLLRPVVTGISPKKGPHTGGTLVTVTGRNLVDLTRVSFGTHQAAVFSCTSATQCTVKSPKGTGRVPVTLTNSAGTSAKTSADVFNYTG